MTESASGLSEFEISENPPSDGDNGEGSMGPTVIEPKPEMPVQELTEDPAPPVGEDASLKSAQQSFPPTDLFQKDGGGSSMAATQHFVEGQSGGDIESSLPEPRLDEGTPSVFGEATIDNNTGLPSITVQTLVDNVVNRLGGAAEINSPGQLFLRAVRRFTSQKTLSEQIITRSVLREMALAWIQFSSQNTGVGSFIGSAASVSVDVGSMAPQRQRATNDMLVEDALDYMLGISRQKLGAVELSVIAGARGSSENRQKTTNLSIKRELGAGASSVVYSALTDKGAAAAKIMRKKTGGFADKLGHEYVALADLYRASVDADIPPFVCEPLYFGEDDREHKVLVTELIPHSVELGDLMAAFGGKLPVQLALHITRQVVAGLHFAYKMRIVHTDIKPANILVCRDGSVILLDWGLVVDKTMNVQPEEGELMGTPLYMSPEQARGQWSDEKQPDSEAAAKWGAHEEDFNSTDLVGAVSTFHHLLLGTAPSRAGSIREILSNVIGYPGSIDWDQKKKDLAPKLQVTERNVVKTPIFKLFRGVLTQKDERISWSEAMKLIDKAIAQAPKFTHQDMEPVADIFGEVPQEAISPIKPSGRWDRFRRWGRRPGNRLKRAIADALAGTAVAGVVVAATLMVAALVRNSEAGDLSEGDLASAPVTRDIDPEELKPTIPPESEAGRDDPDGPEVEPPFPRPANVELGERGVLLQTKDGNREGVSIPTTVTFNYGQGKTYTLDVLKPGFYNCNERQVDAFRIVDFTFPIAGQTDTPEHLAQFVDFLKHMGCNVTDGDPSVWTSHKPFLCVDGRGHVSLILEKAHDISPADDQTGIAKHSIDYTGAAPAFEDKDRGLNFGAFHRKGLAALKSVDTYQKLQGSNLVPHRKPEGKLKYFAAQTPTGGRSPQDRINDALTFYLSEHDVGGEQEGVRVAQKDGTRTGLQDDGVLTAEEMERNRRAMEDLDRSLRGLGRLEDWKPGEPFPFIIPRDRKDGDLFRFWPQTKRKPRPMSSPIEAMPKSTSPIKQVSGQKPITGGESPSATPKKIPAKTSPARPTSDVPVGGGAAYLEPMSESMFAGLEGDRPEERYGVGNLPVDVVLRTFDALDRGYDFDDPDVYRQMGLNT